MTFSEADSKLRHVHMYLYNPRNDHYPYDYAVADSLTAALKIAHQLISENERERMRSIRERMNQVGIVAIGNGLYARTRV